MKIKLTSIYANEHVQAQPGSVIDVSDEEGQSLIAGRFGVLHAEKAKLEPTAPATPDATAETADASAPETAGRRGGRGARNRSTAGTAPATPDVKPE